MFYFIIIFLTIITFKTIAIWLLIIAVLINITAILYEWHSIGENIKRRTGEKPKYFAFFDKITSVLENSIINKIKNTIR